MLCQILDDAPLIQLGLVIEIMNEDVQQPERGDWQDQQARKDNKTQEEVGETCRKDHMVQEQERRRRSKQGAGKLPEEERAATETGG